MIKSIKIKNLQVHKNFECAFTEGVNSIVGESGQGKSAIIRALNMLINNAPRGADKIFRNNSKKPVEIFLTDTDNNTVYKKGNSYKINDGKTLGAIGSSVPDDVTKLFQLEDISWQRQFDGPYLINMSAGAAAKLLQKNSGMEDQEKIIKSLSAQISEANSELKRIKTNEQEVQESINKLVIVKSLRKKINYLITKEKQYEEYNERIDNLRSLIDKTQKISAFINRNKKASILYDRASKILKMYEQFKTQDLKVGRLESKINSLTEASKINPEIDLQLSNTKKMLKKINDYGVHLNKNNSLSSILKDIKNISDEILESQEKSEETKQELAKIKVCPLCKQKTGGIKWQRD